MALTDSFTSLVKRLTEQARLCRQRRALVLSGNHTWCLEHAAGAVEGMNEALWISNSTTHGNTSHIRPRQARQILGTEAKAVVVDAHTGFNPNALGAASGIVRAGGLLVLLCPPLDSWHRCEDPEYNAILSHGYSPEAIQGYFIARIARLLKESNSTTLIEEGHPLPLLPTIATVNTETRSRINDGICRTDDQRKAVEAIIRVATGHRRRPLVMTADRGRGKSASLGIAAAQLLKQGTGSLLVTAPQPDAVESLFKQAARLLPDSEIGKQHIRYNNHTLQFIAPDALVMNPQEAALLMVDEAAAIPAPLLGKLLKQHARIVFSSTIHGYEGSGRGFAIRFRETLDRVTPKWRHQHLEAPIRWAGGDPVEALTFQLLLMEASPTSDSHILNPASNHYRIAKLSQQQLVDNEALLSELFGLLVTAHYQTTPRDLQMLMDSPDLSIHVLYHDDHVAGTVLTVKEGGFSPALANAIWLGERRLRGHLAPQSLANHAGIPAAAELTGERIMRIAIHPQLRRQGLGLHLLQSVKNDCTTNGRDFIASSFGATPELLSFWRQAKLEPVRFGSTRGAASAEHSALVMLPISEAAIPIFTVVRQRFLQQLPLLMSDSLSGIEPLLVAALLCNSAEKAHFTDQDWLDSISFASSTRTYDCCVLAIKKMLLSALGEKQGVLPPTMLTILVLKVLQKHSWQHVAKQCHLSGKKATVDLLRQAVAHLVQRYLPECPTSIRQTLQPLLDRR